MWEGEIDGVSGWEEGNETNYKQRVKVRPLAEPGELNGSTVVPTASVGRSCGVRLRP